MRYPWYTWFSVFGFFIQFIRGAYTILFCTRPLDISKWIVFVGKVAALMFGGLIIPTVILLYLMDCIASLSETAGFMMYLFIWIYVYIIGVLITRKLYVWT